jgi:hypothetical protein
MRTAAASVFCVAFCLGASVAFSQGVPEAPDPARRPESGQPAAKEHPLVPAINLIRERCIPALNQIQDYEALFTKRELIQGKLITQTMLLRVREKPFSVYALYGGENQGREILFVNGANNNQLLAHEGSGFKSVVGTLQLDPRSETAMAENRYPVTHIGMRNLVSQVLQQWEAETRFGEIEVKYYPNAKLGEEACEVIQSLHPHPRDEFRFHDCRLYIDAKTQLPIRIENYTWPTQANPRPQLVEEYTYTKIRPNVGLADADFDRRNPKYKF